MVRGQFTLFKKNNSVNLGKIQQTIESVIQKQLLKEAIVSFDIWN